ncbi:MAG TPA: hypothetical protein VG942_16765 [Hyphomonadaceae bacterium]|nr:hypothetical protein [Hyphomonadaceae bacterium]
MRPVLIALIAAALPAFSYARPVPPAPVREPAPAAAQTEPSKTEPSKLADNSVTAANQPAAPPAQPKFDAPLCASPSVSIENPASTSNGLACKPVMWAGADTSLLQQG